MLAMFVLYMLVDFWCFCLLLFSGTSLGILFIYLLSLLGINKVIMPESYYVTICILHYIVIIYLVFLQSRSAEQEYLLKPIKLIGASIAHELRTPLSIITMQAANLQLEGLNIEKVNKARDNILSSVKRSKHFLESVLINIKGIVAENKNEDVSISECVFEAINNYPFEDNQKDYVFINIKNDFMFKGDKILMIHVISNLLSNALYFSKHQDKPLITITTKISKHQKILAIKDNGIGIDQETMYNIFQPFYTERKAGGTGIGLTFCKVVTEQFGGSIECTSEKGKFTEFKLTFM
jgi:signal transduction histidine kinase